MNDNNAGRRRPPGPDLILHPLRMRIILALADGSTATAADLAERLADVPPATLYRHLNALWRGGILAVTQERRVRGAIERRFALRAGAANLTPEAVAGATRDDHMRWFATYLAGLMDAFGRYLQRGPPDFVRDVVSYRETVMHLDDDEVARMTAALNAALAPFLGKAPGSGRTPRLLATVLLPSGPAVGPDARPPTTEGTA